MANPGNVITQQDDRRYGLPLLIIIPHETAFRSPRPRKVTVAWNNMNQARSMVASTSKGDKAFGMMAEYYSEVASSERLLALTYPSQTDDHYLVGEIN